MFVTAWDTTLGPGTTVPLGLAGMVEAVVEWGDGSSTGTTDPGPLVPTYDTDGVSTVGVTGLVTAYDSAANGGGGDVTAMRAMASRS